MGSVQKKKNTGSENDRNPHLIIAIAAAAVVLIAVGILLGYKLTKKDAPKKAEGGATPTVGAEEDDEDGVWLLSKRYSLSMGEESLEREWSYDEQGRVIQEKTYGSYEYTEYYSYDRNGVKAERWIPAKGGKLDCVWFTDFTGTFVSVASDRGEEYEQAFYDDGSIREFRIYMDSENLSAGGSHEELFEMVTWEYSADRKNVRRKTYLDRGTGQLDLMQDYQFEMDSQGRVVRLINPDDWDGKEAVQSVTEFRYEGKRETQTVTKGKAVLEDVYENGFCISEKVIETDGSGWIQKHWYPNMNPFPESFDCPLMNEWIDYDAAGRESPLYEIEFDKDGQPLRQIVLSTGETAIEYTYGPDGKWNGILIGSSESPLQMKMNIKLDDHGNLVEYTAENGAQWVYGSGARYEWIRMPDPEQ